MYRTEHQLLPGYESKGGEGLACWNPALLSHKTPTSSLPPARHSRARPIQLGHLTDLQG